MPRMVRRVIQCRRGVVQLPQPLLDQLGIQPGDEVMLAVEDGHLVLRKAGAEGGSQAAPQPEAPQPLTHRRVISLREHLERRASGTSD